ncbi:MAG: hypothetical protein A3J37_07960 [Alphaproteobacteria bacterium RIFCSPHIGHO2_12_FULL_45_9]|nr:MAG: hypothetical protein A3B66_03065 [Alphaproteobacteria bacterium RIFCSPHIGHO2_02_FULL_46_13]OFW98322.1 MAG: hypothetical protein A3J37_07960 [Alphaproteobacteria bacterium RIFCSPHIGHO2_12_FULL_45_9]
MFKRKTPLSASQKAMSLLWPSMGWKRMFQYVQLRLIRLKGSTRSIATGFAFGASISFTPLPGGHIIGAGLLSFATRGNLLASLVGTLIGSPWTFPIMWWGAYKTGELAFHLFGAKMVDMPQDVTWGFLVDEITQRPMDLIVPWITGGFILMALSWPIFYILCYRAVDKLRKKYRREHHYHTRHAT